MINLASQKPFFVENGYKVLTEGQLIAVSNGDIASTAYSITVGESSSIICDLGVRYNLFQIIYYRSRATSDSISVYGKQNDQDSWLLIDSADNSIRTEVNSFGADKYRFIRIVHSVSTGTASAREVEIFTKDEFSFGNEEQGFVEKYSVASGAEIISQKVFVRNGTLEWQDFFVLLDGQDSDSVDYELSIDQTGPYYPVYGTGVKMPSAYPWGNGSFSNTTVISNTVRLLSGLSGAYYTPVIDVGPLEGKRVFWQSTVSGTNELDIESRVDSQPTMQVRFSNVKPSLPWVDGQLSSDPVWSIVSGTLPFSIVPNNSIMSSGIGRYFQARIEFHTTISGQTPILSSVGVEHGLKLPTPASSASHVFVRSANSNNNKGKDASLICWHFAKDNDG